MIIVLKGSEDTIGRYINASYIDVSEVTDVKKVAIIDKLLSELNLFFMLMYRDIVVHKNT